jgi:hypothetical protein
MAARELNTTANSLGIIATLLSLMSLVSLLVFFQLNNKVGGILFLAVPILSVLAFIIAVIELVRARRGRSTPDQRYWAKVALVSSLLIVASWVGVIVWILVFIAGMSNSLKYDH